IHMKIDRIGKPFDSVLARVDLPPESVRDGGTASIAEEALKGAQATVEGWRVDGEQHVHGVVDSIHYPGRSTLQRYQYPSSLPEQVVERMADLSVRVIDRIGLESTFNIEYFWDREADTTNLLEVNPRHSQSHAPLFAY